MQSLTADFKQELWTADRSAPLQTETGSLSLKRPNRFRWTYEEPTELTIVADGTQLWIYDVELAQVTVTPFDDTVGASPAMLLSGDRNVREEFDVVQHVHARRARVDQARADRQLGFLVGLIGFSGTEPRRLELVDGLGQVTRIELDNLVVNPEIADDVFELDVPDRRRRHRRRRLTDACCRCAFRSFGPRSAGCSSPA